MSDIKVTRINGHANEFTEAMAKANFHITSVKDAITLSREGLVDAIWLESHYIKKILERSNSLREARDSFFEYLNRLERHYFNIYSDKHFKELDMLEKSNAKECIRVLKNIIRTENEKLTGFSALNILYRLANGKKNALHQVDKGFLLEFLYLFRGIHGKSDIFYDFAHESDIASDNRHASIVRSLQLDDYSLKMRDYFNKYHTGLDREVIEQRGALKRHILHRLCASSDDWQDVSWHMSHIIKDVKTLSSLVTLEKDELQGLRYAERNGIPFQITPYYLSLFNKGGRIDDDRAVRAQVLPSYGYGKRIVMNRRLGADQDFMGEKWTSPIDGITRRYPQILILKPYNSCPQICVYCQRNWEIKCYDEAKVTKDKIKKAIDWIGENESITEVLITGGDPLTLKNRYIGWMIDRVAGINHIERIRIGTRIPVTLPFRINDRLPGPLKSITSRARGKSAWSPTSSTRWR